MAASSPAPSCPILNPLVSVSPFRALRAFVAIYPSALRIAAPRPQPKLDSEPGLELEPQLHPTLRSQVRLRLHPRLQPKVEAQLHPKLNPQFGRVLQSQLPLQFGSVLHSVLTSQLAPKLASGVTRGVTPPSKYGMPIPAPFSIALNHLRHSDPDSPRQPRRPPVHRFTTPGLCQQKRRPSAALVLSTTCRLLPATFLWPPVSSPHVADRR